MLAFVKLRGVGGDMTFAKTIEQETREIIHQRAVATDPAELRDETIRVRHGLEKQRSQTRRSNEVDIKYGSGGMLDVYFAMRYLQLRDNIPDDDENRSTQFMLRRLDLSGSLSDDACSELIAGYNFISLLDHNLRLSVGRTTRLPLSNHSAISTIAGRMGLASPAQLVEDLALHRLAIRSAFDDILG
jgi:glutamate-ammonia-ligase adenylyltransferase